MRAAVDVRPPLDLGLDARALIKRVPLFSTLSAKQLGAVARLLHPRFAVPGEQLIREGDRGDSMFFISSGALEVNLAGRKVRLERGDFVGEMALLSGERRQADVQALTYCQLLVLQVRDFRGLLASSRRIKSRIDRVAKQRARENKGDGALPVESSRNIDA